MRGSTSTGFVLDEASFCMLVPQSPEGMLFGLWPEATAVCKILGNTCQAELTIFWLSIACVGFCQYLLLGAALCVLCKSVVVFIGAVLSWAFLHQSSFPGTNCKHRPQ